jgi:hypothetical protein
MAAQRSGHARQTGLQRIRTVTNLAIAGAVAGTAAMGVFVAHEYGGHTTSTTSPLATATTPTTAPIAPSPGDEGSSSQTTPTTEQVQVQQQGGFAPSPSQGPPQGSSGGS